MTEQQKVISIAKAELGTNEANGGDDKYIKWYGGFRFDVSWCAIFVSWVFYILNNNKYFPKFADCDRGLKHFMDKHQFQMSKAYGGTYKPQPGDIVFFSDKETISDSTHVGIVTYADNTIFRTIEGNSKDMVREKSYSLSSKYVLGFANPYAIKVIVPTPAKPNPNTFNFDDWKSRLMKELKATPSTLLSKTPTLKKGMKSKVVGLLQEFLRAQDYDLGDSGVNKNGVDDSFGGKTEKAVIKYQENEVKLKNPDGVLDSAKATWNKILNI